VKIFVEDWAGNVLEPGEDGKFRLSCDRDKSMTMEMRGADPCPHCGKPKWLRQEGEIADDKFVPNTNIYCVHCEDQNENT